MGVIAMNAYHQQRKHFVPFLAIFTDITSVSKTFGQTGKIAENPYENQSREWGNHDCEPQAEGWTFDWFTLSWRDGKQQGSWKPALFVLDVADGPESEPGKHQAADRPQVLIT